MTTRIIKTAVATLLGILVAMTIVVSALSIFAPMKVSEGLYEINFKRLSATFAVSSYKSSNNYDELQTAIERSIYSDNYSVLVKYGEKYLDDDRFTDLSTAIDEAMQSSGIKYKDYVSSAVVTAMYKKEKKDCIDTALKYLNGYTKNNPLQTLAHLTFEKNDYENMDKIISELNEMKVTATGEELARIENDLNILTSNRQ